MGFGKQVKDLYSFHDFDVLGKRTFCPYSLKTYMKNDNLLMCLEPDF